MFAFGANLDPIVLKNRGIQPLNQVPLILENYKLVFNQPGPWKGAGYADILSETGKTVPGYLYLIRECDAKKMDYLEAGPFLGKHKRIQISQGPHSFYAYKVTGAVMMAGLKPTHIYLKKITDAAAKMPGVTPDQLTELLATPSISDLVPADNINFLIQDHNVLGKPLAPLLKKYDSWCVKFFVTILYPYPLQKKLPQK